MSIYDNDGTTSYEIGKLYDNAGTTNYQIGKVYDYDGTASHLIYNAQSDTYTLTATTPATGSGGVPKSAQSATIANTEGYSKMVVESASASGGNYGANRARVFCNGNFVLDTFSQPSPDALASAVAAWSGSYDIAANGTVYAYVYTEANWDIDDYGDPATFTLKFHFE